MRLMTTPMTACFCVTALLRLQAQEGRDALSKSELSVFAGIGASAQLNAAASPLRFHGRGPDIATEYRRTLRSDRLELSIAASGAARSVMAAELVTATERLTAGRVGASVLRQFACDSSRRVLGVGVAAGADLSLTNHQYANPSQSTGDYLAAFATLGPAASWRERVGGAEAQLQVSAPLVALVDRPYSALKRNDAPTSVRVASLGSFRGIRGELSYAPAERRRTGIVYAYRFTVAEYADVQPLRTASQSLTVGVVRRFGRGPQ
ncbi:MAG: hypothetical protein ABI205_10480 [Gemmatimonadaceae bacterium]